MASEAQVAVATRCFHYESSFLKNVPSVKVNSAHLVWGYAIFFFYKSGAHLIQVHFYFHILNPQELAVH